MQKVFSIREIVLRSAVTFAAAAAVVVLSCLLLAGLTQYESMTRYSLSHQGFEKLYRSIFASIPAAGIVGALMGYLYASQRESTRRILTLFWLAWLVPIIHIAAGRDKQHSLFFLIGLVVIVLVTRKTEILGASLRATLLMLLGYVALFWVHLLVNSGVGNLHDRLAACAYASLWVSYCLVAARIGALRRDGCIAADGAKRFQFSLSSLLVFALAVGAYVTLLVGLFGKK